VSGGVSGGNEDIPNQVMLAIARLEWTMRAQLGLPVPYGQT